MNDAQTAWPNFIAPPQYEDAAPGWGDPALPDFRLIWEVARSAGYAVGLHGSMRRDCDLIAVPWIEAAHCPQMLMHALCGALNAKPVGDAESKPHGRIAYTLQADGWVKPIDLSIMPRAPLAYAALTAEIRRLKDVIEALS